MGSAVAYHRQLRRFRRYDRQTNPGKVFGRCSRATPAGKPKVKPNFASRVLRDQFPYGRGSRIGCEGRAVGWYSTPRVSERSLVAVTAYHIVGAMLPSSILAPRMRNSFHIRAWLRTPAECPAAWCLPPSFCAAPPRPVKALVLFVRDKDSSGLVLLLSGLSC
jgi:hypothetical protein